MIKHTGTFSCHFTAGDQPDKTFDTLTEAQAAAVEYCGNDRYAQPFDGLYLYGPGDGTTSVVVRRGFEVTR